VITAHCLDFSIHRKDKLIELNIHRKPTYIDIVIHFTSNHPYSHKLVAFNYYSSRLATLPITDAAVEKEWKHILTMPCNNGFPRHIIQEIKNKTRPIKKHTTRTQLPQSQPKTWVTSLFLAQPYIR
jgi:hypothetical protein